MLSLIVSRFSRSLNRKRLCIPVLSRVMLVLLASIALACVTAGPALAATTTLWWDAASNPGNWSTTSTDNNWSTSSASGGTALAWDTSADYAVFSNSGYTPGASTGTASLVNSTTAVGIDFAAGSTTIAAGYAAGSGSLTLTGNLITGTTTTVTGPTTFDSSLGTLGLTGNLTWTNTSGQSVVVNCVLAPSATTSASTTKLYFGYNQGNQLTNPYTFIFNGVISDNGSQKLLLNTAVTSGNVNSPYYLELTNANTFTGGSIVGGSGAGGLAITNSAALGTGTVNMNGGDLQIIQNPITLSNPIVITTYNNYINGNEPLTISSATSITSSGVYSGTQELGINDSGLVTVACPVYWNSSNVVGNATKQPTISGSGSITITGNIYNNNAANTAGMNWAYNGTGICTLAGTNNQNSGQVFLTGNGVLQTSQTGGFGNALNLSGSNAPSTAPADVLSTTAGTLGFLNDYSVTFGTGGTGPANGYTFVTTSGNLAIKVDNLTYPGSGPPDSTTGQTLTIGSGTLNDASVLTFVNGHGYSLSMGSLSMMAGSSSSNKNTAVNNNMTSGTASITGITPSYQGTNYVQVLYFGGNSSTAVTTVGAISQAEYNYSLAVTGTGSGQTVLVGANLYSGSTGVTAGTLSLGAIGTVGATLASTSAVTVGNGATFAVTPGIATTSNNSIAGALVINNNGAFSMADGYANTFTVGGNGGLATTVLAPSGGVSTKLTFDVGSGTSDVLAISGSAYVGGAGASINVSPYGALSSIVGTYDVITAGSGLGSNFTLAGGGVFTYGGSTYYENLSQSTPTAEVLQIESGPHAYSTLYYNGAAGNTALSATQSNGNTNFSFDAAGLNTVQSQPASVTDLYFSAANLAASNASISSLGQNCNVASINFTASSPAITLTDTSGTNMLTVSGNSAGIGIASSAANNQTLNVPITLSGAAIVSNSGAGTLTLGGSLTATNLLTFSGSGATVVSGPVFAANGNIAINSGANVSITAPVSLGNSITLTNNNSTPLNLSGGLNANANLLTIGGTQSTTIPSLTGWGGLTVNSGAGPVNVTTVNLGPYAIWTNNSSNTLTVGAISTNDHTVAVEGTGNMVINGSITLGPSGEGYLYKGPNESNLSSSAGSGTLTLTASNNFGGGAELWAGILDIQNGSALGTGIFTATNQVPPNSLYLDSAAGMNVANNMIVSGGGDGNSAPVTGETTTGPGLIQNVQGNNTLSGSISLINGAGPTIIKCNSGSLTLSGTIAANYSGRALYLGGAAPGYIPGVINDYNSYDVSLDMNLIKVDSGMWTLSGTQNTFNGYLTIENGTLAVATLGDSGPGSNGQYAITLGSSASHETATLQFIGSSGTTSRAINLGGNGTIDASGATPLYLTGSITGSNNLTLAGSSAPGGVISGVISLNAGALIKNGGGTWELASPNFYNGGTVINGGTLQIDYPGALGSSSGGSSGGLSVAGGVLDLNGQSPTIGPLNGGTAGVILSSAAASVTLSTSSTVNSVFAGTLSDGAGTLALVVQGPGQLTLSGSGAYSGGTFVEGGTVIATNNEAIEDGSNLYVGTANFPFGTVVAAGEATPANGPSAGVRGAAAAVPEPSTLALLGLGAMLSLLYRQRKKGAAFRS